MLDRLEGAFAQRLASEDRLRQFLADASHELRTPLASIRGYAELFRMGASSDRRGTELAMKRIEEESKRMGVLVEDLLTLARLDETPALHRQSVDLSALAEDAVLRQVLSNLMRNALVHTPAGSAIEVSITDDDALATIRVRDHGPGLPEADRAQLFNRFWRAEHGRERGKAGAGLGLAIAREIVEAHEGQIIAENATGGGAVFTVRLPRAPARQPPSPDADD
jgi:two-component system OmpR family sensor kinase